MHAVSSRTSHAPDEPTALVRAAQSGDREAVAKLLKRYRNLASAVAVRAGCRPAELDDVLQEAALQMLVWLPSLRNPEAFTTWFGQVVLFAAWGHQRKEQRRRKFDAIKPRDWDKLAGSLRDRRTPEAIAEARELSNALDRLPQRVRLAVRMRHLEGLQLNQIGERLGASPATVKRDLASAEAWIRRAARDDLDPLTERKHKRTRGGLAAAAVATLLGAARRGLAAVHRRTTLSTGPVLVVASIAATVAVLAGASLERRRATPVTRTVTEARSPPALRFVDPAGAPAADPSVAVPGLQVWTLTASPADALVESMGVNIRLSEDPQPLSLVRARLAELGIRHVIDVQGSRLDWLASLEPLGVRTNLFIETDADAHAAVAGRRFVEAITLKQARRNVSLATWAQIHRSWMEETRRRLAADRATRHIAIVGATIADDQKRDALGDVSLLVDFAGVGAPARRLPPGGAFLDGTLAAYRQLYGDRPVVTPQVLFATGTCGDCLEEATQAKYVVRTFFEHHRRQMVRTYGTHLFDRTPEPTQFEQGMGLARHDGSKKASFEALVRVIRMFSDRGPPPRPAALRIEVVDSTTHLEHALFQRSDGTFLLALWLAVASSAEDVVASVELRFPSELLPQALHRAGAADPLPLAETDSRGFLTVPVSDDVAVLELSSSP